MENDERESLPDWAAQSLPTEPGGTFETKLPEDAPASAKAPLRSLSLWQIDGDARTEFVHPETRREERPPVYRLHRLIGRGGMGEVFEATQESMQRTIAVKRVRPDLAARHPEAEWEFRTEALVTASLEHPNIVPVHDLGTDEEGRAAIAMKLVRGRAWNAVLKDDFPSLEPLDFLAKHLPIFIATAQAVAFAHTRGIVHRDLKPSQVMTGEFGEVVLMDWGLAIGVETDATPREAMVNSLPTPDSASSPSGTPSYMAPEQAAPNASGIGPWTDVYLLGAILHELLTGRPPHAAPTSEQALLRAMRGHVAPLAATAPPGRPIPRELEAICLRALSVHPHDRYAAVPELVAEVQGYLSGSARRREAAALVAHARTAIGRADGYEAFAAILDSLARARSLWPPDDETLALEESVLLRYAETALSANDLKLAQVLAERIGDRERRLPLLAAVARGEAQQRREKFQRRFTAAAAGIMLVALLAGSGVYARRVAEERDLARRAQEAAERSHAEALLQRERAVAALESSEDLIGFMLLDLRDRLAPRDPKLEILDELSDRAVAHYRRYAPDPATMPLDDLRRMFPGMRSTMDVLHRQGRAQESTEIGRRVQAAALRLLREDDPARAAVWRAETSDIVSLLARQSIDLGDTKGAIEALSSQLATLEAAYEDDPQSDDIFNAMMLNLSTLAVAYHYEGNAELVERHWSKVLALTILAEERGAAPGGSARMQYRRARAMQELALQRELRGDAAGAAETLRETVDLMRGAMEGDSGRSDRAVSLAKGLADLSRILEVLGQNDEAAAALEEAIEVAERTVETHADSIDARRMLAITLAQRAEREEMGGRLDEAMASLRRATDIMESVLEREPGSLPSMVDVARLRVRMASYLQNAGASLAQLEPELDRAEAMADAIRAVPSTEAMLRDVEGIIAQGRYEAERHYGDRARAAEYAWKAAESYEFELLHGGRGDFGSVRNNVAGWTNTVTALEQADAPAVRILAAVRRLAAAADRLRRDHPDQDANARLYTASIYSVVLWESIAGDVEVARSRSEELLDMLSAQHEAAPNDAWARRRLAAHTVCRAGVEARAGNTELARSYAESAELLVRGLAALPRPEPQVHAVYAEALLRLGRIEEAKAAAAKLDRETLRQLLPPDAKSVLLER